MNERSDRTEEDEVEAITAELFEPPPAVEGDEPAAEVPDQDGPEARVYESKRARIRRLLDQAVTFNFRNKGVWIDGWSDLLEGMGAKADEVRRLVSEKLAVKRLPDVEQEVVVATAGGAMPVFVQRFLPSSLRSWLPTAVQGELRPYIILQTSPGALTAIYIEEQGTDLYASWKTFVRGVLNKRLFTILLFVTSLPFICLSLIIAVLSGESVLVIIGTFFGAFVPALLIFLVLVGLLAVLGYYVYQDFLYYFYTQPNVFDVEDITMLGMAADKALRDALKQEGVSEDLLRSKAEFHGSRRGRAG